MSHIDEMSHRTRGESIGRDESQRQASITTLDPIASIASAHEKRGTSKVPSLQNFHFPTNLLVTRGTADEMGKKSAK